MSPSDRIYEKNCGGSPGRATNPPLMKSEDKLDSYPDNSKSYGRRLFYARVLFHDLSK